MRKVLLCTTALLFLAGIAFADTALDKKILADTNLPHAGGVALLDCGGATPLACGDYVYGDNTALPNNDSSYACVGWNESGGETVYELTLASEQIVTFELLNMSADFDIFLLGSCDPMDCLGYADASFTTDCLPAGTYYVVVDGYSGATGTFELSVTCAACPTTPDNDDCAGAIDLCLLAGEKADGPFNFPYSTIGAADDYSPLYGGCTGYTASGGDIVYSVCLQAGGTLEVTQTGDFDMALYLITDCSDPDGSCVAGSDNCCTGADEYINFTSAGGGMYYLIVDGYSTTGTGTLYGTVTGCCTTATEQGSWGAVKTLFR